MDPNKITVTPGEWRQEAGADPAWRTMTLTVTGAAPGVWSVRNSAPGWYLHLYHNGVFVGMTPWNDWARVREIIACQSGPYSVTVCDEPPSVTGTAYTLHSARVAVVRARRAGYSAIIRDLDGNTVPVPVSPERSD